MKRPPVSSDTCGGGLSLVVFLASAIYLLSFSAYGFNIRDEWVIPHGALRVLGGEVPWKDFQAYPPGPYYLHALAFLLFGRYLSVARTLVVLLSALMVVMMVHAAVRLMPLAWALLAGLLLLMAPGVYYARYINFFSLLGILAFFHTLYRWRAPGQARGATVLLGLVAGVTTLFRQDLGLVVLGAAAFCLALRPMPEARPALHDRLSPLLSLTVGAALILLPWGIYYWVHSVLGYILKVHVAALVGGYQKMALPYPRLPTLVGEGRWGELVVFYGPLLVFAVTAGLLLLSYRKRGIDTHTVALTYIVLVGGLTFHQALWRTSFENHVKVIAPILLLACYLLWLGARALWRLYQAHSRLWPVALMGGVLLAMGPALYAGEMLTYPFGFYVGSPSVLRDQLQRLRLPVGRVYAPPHWGIPTAEATQYLKSHTAPGEPIFVLPFAPMFYVLADRPNPSFFEWVLPADPFIYPDLEPRILADLERAQPRYIVFEDFPLDEREERRFRHYAPAISRYIKDRYALEAEFGQFQILRRRHSPGT